MKNYVLGTVIAAILIAVIAVAGVSQLRGGDGSEEASPSEAASDARERAWLSCRRRSSRNHMRQVMAAILRGENGDLEKPRMGRYGFPRSLNGHFTAESKFTEDRWSSIWIEGSPS